MQPHKAWRTACWLRPLAATLLIFGLGWPALAQETPAQAPSLPPAAADPEAAAKAADARCMKCHDDLVDDIPVVHGALKKGCIVCHDGLDASKRPHKVIGPFEKGLSAPENELCFKCHKPEKFKNKVQHKPIRKCSTCHLPHASQYKKLLKQKAPQLCYKCHEEDEFDDLHKHKPVAKGACLECHEAHVSEHPGLLTTAAPELCLDCHEKITKQPHVLVTFSGKSHPTGVGQSIDDPLQPGKKFNCTSCHAPHKSAFPKLNRFDPKSLQGFCTKCHKM